MATPLKLDKLDYAGAIGFFAYASSVVVTPIVLLALARDLNFGLAEGGGMEAVRAGFLMIILLVRDSLLRTGARFPFWQWEVSSWAGDWFSTHSLRLTR